jgi:hypothetical protein
LDTAGNIFAITGVQLELGSTATPFEQRLYGTELALCQRYYESSFPFGTTVANGVSALESGGLTAFSTGNTRTQLFTFQSSKRVAPTMTYFRSSIAGTDGQWLYYSGASWTSATTTTTQSINNYGFCVAMDKSSGFTTGQTYLTSGNWAASAEL